MNDLTAHLVAVLFIGIGATLTFDLWALLLKHTLKIAPSNICLVGRWILYMREGVFAHANIASSPARRAECAVGWCAHYAIGVTLAAVFVAFVGAVWLQQPRLLPAIVFGVVSVLAPFCIMQPAFGLGIAASRTPLPGQARLRSVMNHVAFGAGLYVFALLARAMGFA